jgi:hypothetical protein
MNNAPLVYAIICQRARKDAKGSIVRLETLKNAIFCARIPKWLCYDVIRELEELSLIQRINKYKFEIEEKEIEPSTENKEKEAEPDYKILPNKTPKKLKRLF